MEEKNETRSVEGNVSDALFGTSSDAIIEGLHQGIFTAPSAGDNSAQEPGDNKNQIVNQQDQQGITNALEGHQYTNSVPTATSQHLSDSPAPMSKAEAATILSESEHLDEAGDSEDGLSATNSEKDKIN